MLKDGYLLGMKLMTLFLGNKTYNGSNLVGESERSVGCDDSRFSREFRRKLIITFTHGSSNGDG